MEATLNGPTGRTTLGPEILTIGRMPGNQLLITDSQSSGHHAEIRPEGQAYSIIDLGSTNGTFVNEQQLAPQVPRQLISGDRIRIGQTVLIYEVSGADAFASTAYINQPAKGDRPAFEPTVAVPPPSFDGYGANEQQNSQPPPPPPPGYQAAFNPAGSAPPVPPGYVPVPAQKKRGRGLWITLGIIAAVLLLSC